MFMTFSWLFFFVFKTTFFTDITWFCSFIKFSLYICCIFMTFYTICWKRSITCFTCWVTRYTLICCIFEKSFWTISTLKLPCCSTGSFSVCLTSRTITITSDLTIDTIWITWNTTTIIGCWDSSKSFLTNTHIGLCIYCFSHIFICSTLSTSSETWTFKTVWITCHTWSLVSNAKERFSTSTITWTLCFFFSVISSITCFTVVCSSCTC